MLFRRLVCVLFAIQSAWGPYAFADKDDNPDNCAQGDDKLANALQKYGQQVRDLWTDGDCAGFKAKVDDFLTEGQPPCENCKAHSRSQADTPQEDADQIVRSVNHDHVADADDVQANAGNSGGVGSLFNSSSLMWGLGGALLGGIFGYMLGKNSVQTQNYGYPYWMNNAGYGQVPGYGGMGGGMPGMFGGMPGAGGMLPGMYPGMPGGMPMGGFGGLPQMYPAPMGGFGGGFNAPYGGFGGMNGGAPAMLPYGGGYNVGTPYPYNLGFNGGAGLGYYNNGWYNGGTYQPGVSSAGLLGSPIYNAPAILPYNH